MEFLVVENQYERAKHFERLGVDYIFVDLEKLGKQERQSHIDSVKSNHSIDDVFSIKKVLNKAQVLVRIDPINKNTKSQIDSVISSGADVIMLPYFRKKSELDHFFNCIQGRVRTKLLFEHIESLDLVETAHKEFEVTELYFGLNDLSLSLGYSFMFEVLGNRILDQSVKYCSENNIKFGIGGIGPFEEGQIPGKIVIKEYKRLGATSTIISRGLVNLFNNDEIVFFDNLIKLKNEWSLFEKNSPLLKDNFEVLKKLIRSY